MGLRVLLGLRSRRGHQNKSAQIAGKRTLRFIDVGSEGARAPINTSADVACNAKTMAK